jgi:hypothetical protein
LRSWEALKAMKLLIALAFNFYKLIKHVVTSST